MAHISGQSGLVVAGVATGTTVTGIKAWSCDYTIETLESTDFADVGVRTFILGPSTWAGTFEGWKDGVPLALSTATTLLQLREAPLASATGAVWTGAAFITGIHNTVSFDGIVSYSYDFQGTGALTLSTA